MIRIRIILSSILLFWTAIATAGPICAQSQTGTPPVNVGFDRNGVDVIRGSYGFSELEVVIGQPGEGGLVHSRTLNTAWTGAGWRDSLAGTIKSDGTTYTVSLGGGSETFTETSLGSGVFTSDQARGSSLTVSSGQYTYTSSDGAVAIFSASYASSTYQLWLSDKAVIVSRTEPSGAETDWHYVSASAGGQTGYRPQSVTNTFGYQIHFQYADDSPADTSELAGAWLTRTKVTGINRAYYYCSDTATSCSDTGGSVNWPYVTYGTESSGAIQTVTDRLNRTKRYVFDGDLLTGVRSAASPYSNMLTIEYDGYNRVGVFSNVEGSTTYDYSTPATGVLRITANGPDVFDEKFDIDIATGRVTDYHPYDVTFVAGGKHYNYDTAGRLVELINEQETIQFSYDARGNITQTTRVPNFGSLSNIVTSASFPSTCSNPVTCNKPDYTVDERGYQTQFHYNSTHGGLEWVRSPAPSGSTPYGSGTQPETRFSYSALSAYYKNSGGTLVAGPAIYMLTGTSACMTGGPSSCGSSSADETKLTIAYGGTGVANNLLQTSQSAGAGDGSLSITSTTSYDERGDVLTIDGPLSGSSDTTYFFYADDRQVRAVVSPDPDGGSARPHRVVRTNYDSYGRPSSQEIGKVSTPSSWASMTVLQAVNLEIDAPGRVVKESSVAGGTTYSVRQFSYDHAGRPLCSAVRMNPSTYSSLPDPCDAATAGSYGKDRIARNLYSVAGDWADGVQTGLEGQIRSSGFTLGWGGCLASAFSEGVGPKEILPNFSLVYECDGFGRVIKEDYDATYEGTTYDAYGRVSSVRRRDGQTISYSYDNLGHVLSEDPSGSEPTINYAYDNLNRMTSAAYASGQSLTYSYDALGRLTAEIRNDGVSRTVSYEYDAAGHRTKMTWPDGFYVNYDYDSAGGLLKIRENGATSGVGVLATYAYDDYGRLSSLTRGSGGVTGLGYDAISRPIDLAHDIPGGSSYDQWLDLDYNPAGQLASRTASNTAWDWSYPGSTFTDVYVSDAVNRYTSADGVTPTYDSRGNMTYDGTKTYGYDVYNHLVSATGGVTLAYDPAGRLYETAGGSTTRFFYDGVDVIAEYDASGNVLRRYVHGPMSDNPLVWYEGSGTSDRRWLYADERGSITAIESSGGVAIDRYDEFGVPDGSNTGRFQYTGQIWIPELGLYHYKARVYSPKLGRFLQSDPIGAAGGFNFYNYASSDPINMSDPLGLEGGATIHVIWACDTWIKEIIYQCDYNDPDDRSTDGWAMNPGGGGGGGAGGGSGPSISDILKNFRPPAENATPIPARAEPKDACTEAEQDCHYYAGELWDMADKVKNPVQKDGFKAWSQKMALQCMQKTTICHNIDIAHKVRPWTTGGVLFPHGGYVSFPMFGPAEYDRYHSERRR